MPSRPRLVAGLRAPVTSELIAVPYLPQDRLSTLDWRCDRQQHDRSEAAATLVTSLQQPTDDEVRAACLNPPTSPALGHHGLQAGPMAGSRHTCWVSAGKPS